MLGALTDAGGLPAAQIGKINVSDFSTYVAVDSAGAGKAPKALNHGNVKGKKVKALAMEGKG